LRLAVENEIKTIAFPAISCGVYGYPISHAAQVAVGATTDFLKKENRIEKVIFALFGEEIVRVYQDLLGR
jgi:O-acetyl-ADP-ribose deacetylase (regulator of RNase III)